MSAIPHSRLLGFLPLILILSTPGVGGAGDSDGESILGPPPGNYRILSEDGVVRIPFEIYRGDIRMTAEIKGRPVRMLLDNGFLWDSVLFFGGPSVDSLGLVYDGEVDVGGSGEGDAVPSKTASGITIRFPGVEFTEQTGIVAPGTGRMWTGAEGQVSATFLKHFVVDINFDTMVITLIEPEKFHYSGKGTEVRLKPLIPGAWGLPATLRTSDGRILDLDLMMDLGQWDALNVSTTGPHDLRVPGEAIAASLGFGVQGEIHGHFGRVPGAEIGGYRTRDIVCGFTSPEEGWGSYHEAMIGLELLSRFNLVFDYPGGRMFIEPNRTFADPFEYDMSGMALRKKGDDHLEIVRVTPGSAAEAAGLRVGDEVVKIQGIPASEYDVWDLWPVMRREGRAIPIVIRREGKETEVVLTLKRLI